MEFIFFVCNEVLGYLKDKLIYGGKNFDLATIWNDEKMTIKSKIKEIEKIISKSKLIDGRC